MKQIFGPIFKSMLKGEMENHLGYEKHERATGCDDARMVLEEVDRWRTRPLKPFYPFAFVNCIYVSMRTEYLIRNSVRYIPS